jgi:PAS domain S-box-containing protein
MAAPGAEEADPGDGGGAKPPASFRAVFEQAAIGMATVGLDGRILRTNEAFRELAVSTEAELRGREVIAVADEAIRPALRAMVEAVIYGREESLTLEHRLASGTGWVVSTVSIVRDADARPVELLVQVQDDTARRGTMEALARSEERFRLMVESVGDYAIFMLDPAGRIASWNAGAERTKGYTAAEVIGQDFSIFYTEADRARGHPADELAIAVREGRYEEEGRRVRKDGSTFWANVVITPIRDVDGALRGFAKVTRDITERRRLLDELEEIAAERTQFLAVTAHELRTPIAVVNGFASTLRDRWEVLEDVDRREMLAALSRGGERLGRLVEELLTASRLEAGALEIRSTVFDVAVVVRQAVDDMAATTDTGGAP